MTQSDRIDLYLARYSILASEAHDRGFLELARHFQFIAAVFFWQEPEYGCLDDFDPYPDDRA